MTLYVENRQDSISISDQTLDDLEQAITTALATQNFTGDYEISLSFVTQDEMRILNREYRGIDRTTDVLSFPTDFEIELPIMPLGDIVIDPMRAAEQAEEIGHSLEEELLYLTIHSVMHLLGYDHMEEEEKRSMREAEKKALSEVRRDGAKEEVDGV